MGIRDDSGCYYLCCLFSSCQSDWQTSLPSTVNKPWPPGVILTHCTVTHSGGSDGHWFSSTLYTVGTSFLSEVLNITKLLSTKSTWYISLPVTSLTTANNWAIRISQNQWPPPWFTTVDCPVCQYCTQHVALAVGWGKHTWISSLISAP